MLLTTIIGGIAFHFGWAGEIQNFEDDMAGRYGSECHITECSIAESGHPFRSVLTADNTLIGSDDPYEWGYTTPQANAIDIWDKNPQQ